MGQPTTNDPLDRPIPMRRNGLPAGLMEEKPTTSQEYGPRLSSVPDSLRLSDADVWTLRAIWRSLSLPTRTLAVQGGGYRIPGRRDVWRHQPAAVVLFWNCPTGPPMDLRTS